MFRRTDWIGVAGILLFAAAFFLDSALSLSLPLYLALVGVSLVLLAVGAFFVFRNHRNEP